MSPRDARSPSAKGGDGVREEAVAASGEGLGHEVGLPKPGLGITLRHGAQDVVLDQGARGERPPCDQPRGACRVAACQRGHEAGALTSLP